MTQRYFITGTDTECGKTWVTTRLARQFVQTGKRVACFKPLASGAEYTNGHLCNDDALQLRQAASIDIAYTQVNPYCFEPAIAPHIAAWQADQQIDLDVITQCITSVDTDIVLIEGFGGWLAPVAIQDQASLWQSDIVRAVNAEVIVVVGMKLGCLNHAQLTINQIRSDRLPIAGWIANPMQVTMPLLQENINTLDQLLPVSRWELP